MTEANDGRNADGELKLCQLGGAGRHIIASVLCTLCLSLFATPAAAETRNPQNIFASVKPCSAYQQFLEGVDPSEKSTQNCAELEKFVISLPELGNVGGVAEAYLETFMGHKEFGESPLAGLAMVLEALVLDEPRDVFQLAGQISFNTSYAFGRANALERAHLYSTILIELQRLSVLALVQGSGQFAGFEKGLSIADVLGERFSHLDEVRIDFVYLCLLRTDAINLPIRQVVSSPRFQSCISFYDERNSGG